MNKKKEISNAIKKLKDENRCYGLDYLVVFLVNERKLNVKDFHSMKLKRCILEHLNNILYKQDEGSGAIKELPFLYDSINWFNSALKKQLDRQVKTRNKLEKNKSKKHWWSWTRKNRKTWL